MAKEVHVLRDGLRGRAGLYRQRRMNQQSLAAVIADPPEPLHIAPTKIKLRAILDE